MMMELRTLSGRPVSWLPVFFLLLPPSQKPRGPDLRNFGNGNTEFSPTGRASARARPSEFATLGILPRQAQHPLLSLSVLSNSTKLRPAVLFSQDPRARWPRATSFLRADRGKTGPCPTRRVCDRLPLRRMSFRWIPRAGCRDRVPEGLPTPAGNPPDSCRVH